VKGKGNDAPHTLEGNAKDTVWIARNNPRTNQSQYGQCTKESIEEHYECNKGLILVSIVTWSVRNGGKGER